jgi:two-component system, NtrC family, response regulator AtoC
VKARTLIVDDDQSMCEMLDEALTRRGYATQWRVSAGQAFEILETEDFDVIVTDLNMTGINGIDLCGRIVSNRPDIPVVVLTAFGSLDTAVAAMRAGAYDFITKPVEIEALDLALARAVRHRMLREEVKRLRQAVDASQHFGEIIGASPPMARLFDLVARASETDASVLLSGESGTGKELVARALHRRGRRQQGPFVAVNCAAMPENLLESELFGHTRGAFTDARSARAGLFAQATGGTLFLDEIGEMPLGLQPKLLRALQERVARPVGSDVETSFDVRVIAATNRDLETAVEERRFREDLFFRINVIPIEVPPLRMRGNDILLLAQHFLGLFAAESGKRVAGFTSAAAERLLGYSWPGNVRELRNSIERAVALGSFEQVTVEDLPEKVRSHRGAQIVIASDDPAELLTLEEVERRYTLRVLEAAGGNKTLAARILGLDRKTLYRRLERLVSRKD